MKEDVMEGSSRSEGTQTGEHLLPQLVAHLREHRDEVAGRVGSRIQGCSPPARR